MSTWMTDTNHLRNYLQDIEPQQMDNVVNELFIARKDRSTPFLSDLELGSAKTMLLTKESDSWKWKFKKPLVPAEVAERTEVGNTTVGRGKAVFSLILDRDWYTYGDVISPDRFSGKAVRVIPDGVIPLPNGWTEYRVQLVTDDILAYFPSVYLEEGTQYVYLYSIYGEYNDQGTKVVHAGEMELMNSLAGELRTEDAITDWADALTITMNSVTVDDRGKPVKLNNSSWFKRSELAVWSKHRLQKENYIFWGVPGNNLMGPSRYSVDSGMGAWHMAHLGNVQYYSNLTLRKLEEPIGDMYYGRKNMSERDTVLYTGEAGFLLFSYAVEHKLNGLGGLIPLDKFITGSGMDMGFGYQFKSYIMPNGGRITLKHLSLLDQDATKSERGTGRYSKQSATFLGFDMSSDSAENMKIVKRATRPDDYWGYVPGTCGPTGPMKGGISASKKAGYEMWVSSRVGFHMHDTTKAFILKPTFDF